MITVRMFEGFYGREEMGSDSDYFLEPVAFPMEQKIPHAFDQGDDAVVITNELELEAWAQEVFVEHAIFNMEIPDGAILSREDE